MVPQTDHPVVKSLNPLNLKFASSIDTTSKTKTPIRRQVLLTSSPRSRLQYNPVRLNFDFLQVSIPSEQFDKGPQILSVALEGSFPSLYENRVRESMLEGLKSLDMEFKIRSVPTRMIVVSDGDIAKSKVNYEKGTFLPLGYNDFEKFQFSNKEFLVNALEYLLDTRGVIEARSKEVKLRLLDQTRAQNERAYWQFLNLGLPLIFIAFFGILYNFIRRRRFGK